MQAPAENETSGDWMRTNIPAGYAEEDAFAYALAPNVVLLGTISHFDDCEDVRARSSLFGYDLDELRSGRSTIVGLLNQTEFVDRDARFTVLGPSMVDVLTEAQKSYEPRAAWQLRTDHHDDALERLEVGMRDLGAVRRELEGSS